MKKPSEILKEKDWIQGKLFRRKKYNDDRIVGCCMVGALELAYNECGLDKVELEKLRNAESLLHKNIEMRMAEWNDMPGRTKEECIAKLEEFGL